MSATPDPMDPRKQECHGHYLYGAGYFSRDQNTLGLLQGRKAPPHFCLSCPKRESCEDAHEARVRELNPEASEEFDRLMMAAMRRGYEPTLAAVLIGSRGKDPYAREAVENFKLGHAHRGLVSGPLTK